MSTQAVTPNPNGNPFDALASDGTQPPVKQASSNGNPFDALATTQQPSQPDGGASIQPVTTATNPKLAAAMAAKDMPEYVGATGAVAAGTMGASLASPVVDAAIAHLGGLTKIVQAAKNLGWTTFGIKEAHDLYKMVAGDSKK